MSTSVEQVLKSARRDRWDVQHSESDDSETTSPAFEAIRFTKSGNIYRPVGETVPKLDPWMYVIRRDNNGLLFVGQNIVHDELINLKDSVSSYVIDELEKFWSRRDRYDRLGRVYKRGILLHGLPGVGKTATVIQVANRVIASGGLILFATCPDDLSDAIAVIRVNNANVPIVAVLEDMETITAKHGEDALLSLLDGERQSDNVVFLATTNFVEKLGDRFTKRPSRFDLVVEVKPPSEDLRRQYIINTLPELTDEEHTRMVEISDGFGISHLKEMILLIEVYDYSLDAAHARVREMVPVEGEDEESDDDD